MSYASASGPGNVALDNQGEIGAYADINVPDPDALCFNPDCYLSHTFRWKNGHLTELDTIRGNTNAASGINSSGWIAGSSLLGETDPSNGLPIGHAVLWKQQRPIDLGTLSGTESLSRYVNDAGQLILNPVIAQRTFPTGFQVSEMRIGDSPSAKLDYCLPKTHCNRFVTIVFAYLRNLG